jgi:HK97 family phage portal protein
MGLISRLRGESRAASAPVEERAQVRHEGAEGVLGQILNGENLSESVTLKEALRLPGVWAAVNFLSGTLAGLPLELYDRKDGVATRQTGPLADMLGAAVNEDLTSFDWREMFFSEVFGPGRGYAYIERGPRGEPENIFPMEYEKTTVRRERGRVFYDYREESGRVITYPSADVIDVAFLRRSNFVQSYCPATQCGGAVRQMINSERYALTVFGKNGVPPYTLKGAFSTAKEAARAALDVMKVTRRAAEEGRPILPLPAGTDLARLGDDPEKMQLTLVQKFSVEQAARIYQLPPLFLQDLSKGTFANTEQQDLNLVKHTLRRWVKKFEQQLNLKLFGRGASRFVRLNIDGLLRGDFKTRMEGIAKAIQNGQLTPNEGRELDNRPPLPGGYRLMIQGATVPIETVGTAPPSGDPPPDPGDDPDPDDDSDPDK